MAVDKGIIEEEIRRRKKVEQEKATKKARLTMLKDELKDKKEALKTLGVDDIKSAKIRRDELEKELDEECGEV